MNFFSFKFFTQILSGLFFLVFLSYAAENRAFPLGLNYKDCIKPNNVDQANMDRSILNLWNSYKSKYLKPSNGGAQGGGYFILMKGTGAGPGDKTTSEAHGWGMIFSVLMAGSTGDPDGQKYFDGFYNMFDKNRSRGNPALMSWVIGLEENSHESTATDGDMDIAYALILAHYQWGSNGSINYLEQAKKMITDGIKKSEMGVTSKRTTFGEWDKRDWPSRSSDWMTDHMIVYEKVTGDSYWSEARTTVYDLVQKITNSYSPNTGLMPDFIVENPPRPSDPNFLEGPNDPHFSWNACRFPLRMAVDYAHYGSPQAKQAMSKIANWIKGATNQNPAAIKAGYQLNGTPLADYSSAAFTGPMVALSISDVAHQDYLNKGWAQLVATTYSDYYSDSIKLLSMLLISGNWWIPSDNLSNSIISKNKKSLQGWKLAMQNSASNLSGQSKGNQKTFSMDGKVFFQSKSSAMGTYLIGYPAK